MLLIIVWWISSVCSVIFQSRLHEASQEQIKYVLVQWNRCFVLCRSNAFIVTFTSWTVQIPSFRTSKFKCFIHMRPTTGNPNYLIDALSIEPLLVTKTLWWCTKDVSEYSCCEAPPDENRVFKFTFNRRLTDKYSLPKQISPQRPSM